MIAFSKMVIHVLFTAAAAAVRTFETRRTYFSSLKCLGDKGISP